MTLRRQPTSPIGQRDSSGDRCPGVFATHPAADGPLARIRLPGGAVTAPQLAVLADAAARYGDGFLEFTGRANIQLRAITDVDAVATLVTDAGLSPGSDAERLRNVVSSPLSGRVGGIADVGPLVAELDAAVTSGRAPAGLSRRFWFGVDDGRGDVLAQRADVTVVATGDDRFDVVIGGRRLGSTSAERAVGVLLDVAAHFTAAAPDAWRIADVDARLAAAICTRVSATLDPAAVTEPTSVPERTPLVGWFEQDDGRVLLGATVPLGRLPARTAEFLAAISAPLIVTVHREILVCDLTEGVAETVVRVLAPMGLIFDAESPWTLLSSCAGAPGCAKSLAPVREDLIAYVRDAEPGTVTAAEHWIGCARGCGAPTHAHVRVEAQHRPTTYRRTTVS